MTSAEEDYYGILGIDPGATDAQINKAFRKKALTCHPDKVGDDKEAAALFHLLSVAVEVLLNPTSRATYDGAHKARLAQKARISQMDSRRRKQREELDAREEAVKRRKAEASEDALKRYHEIERLREEGARKMRAEEERRNTAAQVVVDIVKEERLKRESVENASVEDCTLTVKWKRKRDSFDAPNLQALFEKFGEVDKAIVPNKEKGRAILVFKSVVAAYDVMKHRESSQLKRFDIDWAGGREPEATKHLKLRDSTAPQPNTPSSQQSGQAPPSTSQYPAPPQSEPKAFPSFAGFPSFPLFAGVGNNPAEFCTPPKRDDYEALILQKMRDAEREKLKAKILEDEATQP